MQNNYTNITKKTITWFPNRRVGTEGLGDVSCKMLKGLLLVLHFGEKLETIVSR